MKGAAPAAVDHGPRCGRCASDQLRRPRSRTRLQRLVRRATGWDRYACQSCGHHGWVWGSLAGRAVSEASTVASARALAGPRMELRDQRLRQRRRRRFVTTVGLSLALGVAVALYLQRCGAVPPPVD